VVNKQYIVRRGQDRGPLEYRVCRRARDAAQLARGKRRIQVLAPSHLLQLLSTQKATCLIVLLGLASVMLEPVSVTLLPAVTGLGLAVNEPICGPVIMKRARQNSRRSRRQEALRREGGIVLELNGHRSRSYPDPGRPGLAHWSRRSG